MNEWKGLGRVEGSCATKDDAVTESTTYGSNSLEGQAPLQDK